MKNRVVLAAGLYAAVAVGQDASSCSSILIPKNGAPVVASGWQAQLVAGGFTKPRSIEFDSTGALIVLESGKGISRHRFTDNGGTCLSANHSHMLVELTTLNHGLALSNDGKTLYASSAESVLSWNYDAAGGAVSGDSRILVSGMSNNDLVTRTLFISKKQEGTLVVSRGSAEQNRDRAAVLESGLSQIRAFDIGNLTINSAPYNFNSDGTVLGWGLRNSVGVGEHPATGGIYAVENSVDGATRNGKDVKENNPGEELNFFGYLNGTAAPNQGKNFGYPHCFAVWDPAEIPDGDGLEVGKQFAVQENNTLSDETCASDYVGPRLTFPAHYAPMDIKFNAKGDRAFITFRGSFDKSSPVGYRVSSIGFDPVAGEPLAAASSTSPLDDIITNQDNSKCPDGCFRPVGLAVDGKGRIWFSSDATGEIYVLQKLDSDTEAGRFVQPSTGGGGGGGGSGGNGNGNGKNTAAAGRGQLGWETRLLGTLGLVTVVAGMGLLV